MLRATSAAHIEQHVMDKPKGWLPLVYCWRGGKRSGTLAWFLSEIGFRTCVVEGGHKAWRAAMVAQLDELPARFEWRVICGRTGSGKTRLLHALRDAGAQVLDLEGLACHRGSVLGLLPHTPQPSQKAFDTAIWDTLRRFDPAQPVFVESESKKVGNLHVPTALIERMREHGGCLRVDMPDDARVRLLLEDYAFFRDDVELFCSQLDALAELRGKAVVQAWQAAAREGRFAEVFLALMHEHYDPTYLRSIERNFKHYAQATVVELPDARANILADAAARMVCAARGTAEDRAAQDKLPHH
jgi:tRNA 2-selenouridine synthase